MNTRAYVPADTPWHLISLRPRGGHASLRHAAARVGAGLIALSPWYLQAYDDPESRRQLTRALAADRVVFTSPAAVNAAARLAPLHARHSAGVLAVGEGTARALRRHGVREVLAPSRMDSEGLLALPALSSLQGLSAGLVTAPGGRGLIAAQLQARGAELIRANVYERVALPLPPARLRRLQALTSPSVLAVSSGEALLLVLPQLPADLRSRWQQQPVVTAGPRLAELAAAQGFTCVRAAAGPMPAQLAAAARDLLRAR
ncbi:uroporphyrinogen-III synthase [Stenotrophomonas sp. YIM B06876]|uniref:uroporphyrinogen-III synthase n=1 Tax=Stenotrophomonas sp. YIM B06876 TaxID=3060211 RepID=UPI0027387DA4|nr:uroporphyrinogen-III synthase [Stenotrophomonas sp. YIM B06876]